MFLIRYAALCALVVWLGGAVLVLTRPGVSGLAEPFQLTAVACGTVIIVCLFVMKFMGPPPHAFAVRTAIALAMTAMTGCARWFPHLLALGPATTLRINLALGLMLLAWYARE